MKKLYTFWCGWEADDNLPDRAHGREVADRHEGLAERERGDVLHLPGVLHADGWHAYPEFCLEAAARVEEGSWNP